MAGPPLKQQRRLVASSLAVPMQMGASARPRVSCASGDEEGCAFWFRAASFFARLTGARAKSLAAILFGCKHEAESVVSARSGRSLITATPLN